MPFHHTRERPLIFGLSSGEKLASKVCKILGGKLGTRVLTRFPSGEILTFPVEPTENRDVYIIQSTSPPVDENLMDLLIFIDALKQSKAKSITCIIPYFGYARQDRAYRPGEPVTRNLIVRLLSGAGCDRILAFELHSPLNSEPSTYKLESVSLMPLLADAIKKDIDSAPGDWIIVSPDRGGVRRARYVSDSLNIPLIVLDKRRDSEGNLISMSLSEDVKGKHCFIVDDMIDTGSTALRASEALQKSGALSVSLAAVHPVFSGGAVQNLMKADLDHILVTDTIPIKPQDNNLDLTILSVAQILGETIERLQSRKH